MTTFVKVKPGGIIIFAMQLIHDKKFKHQSTLENETKTVYTYAKGAKVIRAVVAK